MKRMNSDKDKYLDGLMKERKSIFEKKLSEFNVMLTDERKQRLERRKEERIEERRRKWIQEKREEFACTSVANFSCLSRSADLSLQGQGLRNWQGSFQCRHRR